MIDFPAELVTHLTAIRTLTEAQVHANERVRDQARESLTPGERQDQCTGHAEYGAAQH